MTVGTLYTFGYATVRDREGLRLRLDDLVDLVIDVRINRFSGMLPFSKRTQETVEAAGYEYLWLKGLGNAGHRRPGPMHLADPSQVQVVVDELRAGRSVAIMCACPNIWRCHRRLVSQLAREAIPELEVVNL
jgi:uncharacterized protein (DUF488 family)